MSKRCSSCLKLVFNPCLAFVACQTGAYDEILVRHCGLCAAAHSNYLTGLVNGADRVYPPKWLAPSHSYAVDSTPPLYSVCTPCSCTPCLLPPFSVSSTLHRLDPVCIFGDHQKPGAGGAPPAPAPAPVPAPRPAPPKTPTELLRERTL
jgi:hypothetical protein